MAPIKRFFDSATVATITKKGIDAYGRWLHTDTAFQTNWMGPDQPPPPTEIVDPRIMDYDVGENLKHGVHPGREGISFIQLRAFSEAVEIVRLVIEKRKDQISTYRFDFQLKNVEGKSPTQVKSETENSASIKKARELFAKPDGFNPFRSWVRMILEEVMVLDHLCILPRRNLTGEFFQFPLIDGSTIVKRIDANGFTPIAPTVAYQQLIKGVITSEYISSPVKDASKQPLIVFHRNPRVSKIYGFPPTEQIIEYMNIILRRQHFQLNYYTEGNIPDMILRVSKEFGDMSKIAKFQRYWDMLRSGDLAKRRKLHFIPDTSDPIYPQQDVLSEDQEFEEQLIRIVTYCFGATANHFIRNLNRSVSEQSREQSDEEGLFSYIETIREVVNLILIDYLGLPDIELVAIANRSQDSLKQAEIDQIDSETGIRSIDEIRDSRGLPPIGFGNAVKTANGYVSLVSDSSNKLEPQKTTNTNSNTWSSELPS